MKALSQLDYLIRYHNEVPHVATTFHRRRGRHLRIAPRPVMAESKLKIDQAVSIARTLIDRQTFRTLLRQLKALLSKMSNTRN